GIVVSDRPARGDVGRPVHELHVLQSVEPRGLDHAVRPGLHLVERIAMPVHPHGRGVAIELDRGKIGSRTMNADRGWRLAAAIFWLASGANHFRAPRFYEAIVPPPLDRWKREVSALAGAAELVGG